MFSVNGQTVALTIPTQLIPNALYKHRTVQSQNYSKSAYNHSTKNLRFRHMFRHKPLLITRASSDGGGFSDANPHQSVPSELGSLKGSSSSVGDGYVSLFIRMLGLDNDPLDREQAVVSLWKFALGGKQYIDNIMQFHGCINLIINLLKSESYSASEAAAGLLRTISSVNTYRDLVAESGAIEEITGLLSRPSLASEVKEQSICTLWNLSVDEKYRRKIASYDLLPLLIKSLDDEHIKVQEAAGGVLANLSLTPSNHSIMVEAGAIPKLATLLKLEDGSKIIRKEAKNALLELAKDEYYRILVVEEGLVLVPLIGGAAYKSFRPVLHSWPSLPDGTEIEQQSSKAPSRFGASELLLGLNIDDKNANIEEAKMNAIVGRTHQQFLARIGAIEMEDEKELNTESLTNQGFTLLPWRDGVARLVLILELQDESAIIRAAESIADACINEHMRISFKEAGAVKHLVQLLDYNNNSLKLAVIRALERLSVSNDVCNVIEVEGVLYPLFNTLKQSPNTEKLTEKTLDILARILDPSKEMKLKFYDGPVNGIKKGLDSTRKPASALDSDVIARVVEILKTSSPNLQKKAASILEFVAIIEPSMENIVLVNIESALDAVFQLKVFQDMDLEMDIETQTALALEEAGLAVSAASRLLSRLLDSDQFCKTLNAAHFTKLLRTILKSNIPLPSKNWVAACLMKLSYLSGPNLNLEYPITAEVTLYETIPRLIEQIKSSFSPEVQQAAVIELNKIVSDGTINSTRAIADQGGIFPLVKLVDEGSGEAVEAGLAILYNLSMDSENHSAIVAAGAVPVLRKIVLSQKPQWKQALHLLRTLPT